MHQGDNCLETERKRCVCVCASVTIDRYNEVFSDQQVLQHQPLGQQLLQITRFRHSRPMNRPGTSQHHSRVTRERGQPM